MNLHPSPAEHLVPAPLALSSPGPAESSLDIPPSVIYSGWRLTRLSDAPKRTVYVACKVEDKDHSYPAVTLTRTHSVFSEGYWPFRPAYVPRIILGGTCLYTAAWAIRFAGAGTDAKPRPLSMGLPGDLTRILKLLKKGRRIESFQLPTRPGLYHRLLMGWQSEVLRRFPSVETIRYTLPIHDYHGYIMQLETALNRPLPGLHQALDGYVRILQTYLKQIWGEFTQKLQFDTMGSSTFKSADATSRENDLQLYLNTANQDRVMGMEDLPEVALAHEVARRMNVMIPCAVVVLGLPDPYTAREDTNCACQFVPLEEMI